MKFLTVLLSFLSGTGFGIFIMMVADYICDNYRNHEEERSEIDDLIKKHNKFIDGSDDTNDED